MLILLLIASVCLTLVVASLFLLRPATKSFPPSPAADVYLIENKVVYYIGKPDTKTVVVDAHARTFQVLTASAIGNPLPSRYARDFENVYFCGKIIPGANPVYFQILRPDLARDDRNVFKATHLISTDAKNFKCLDEHLSKDSQNVYFDDQVISKDAGNFRFVGKWQKTCFYKDQSKVFVNGKSYRVADIDTFDYTGNGVFTDRYQVYKFQGDSFQSNSGQHIFRALMQFQPVFG
ncbi:DKNYY domain-containing protein [Dyadobacter sp. CY261]|uniref:DKNYY domain-containing protein n=1 Tax=Dyadobacter sp. CY261 TaxID=2907203 RepID=UPI001F42060D|nr:DKNYY domain-containing protein [Dyadobacter sp. CY261]MCF0074689.1 DKNYY domain-containing protein [Dyadobacter sp. CY261]